MLLTVVITLVGFLFGLFPLITELPWGLDAVVVQGVGGYKLLATAFPPLSTVLTIFLIYISFRLGMILLRFFLGSRTPTTT